MRPKILKYILPSSAVGIGISQDFEKELRLHCKDSDCSMSKESSSKENGSKSPWGMNSFLATVGATVATPMSLFADTTDGISSALGLGKRDGDGSGSVPTTPIVKEKMIVSAGSSLKLEDVCNDNVNERKQNSWSRCSAETFSLRIGPNYKQNQQKAPSAAALYECVGVDWVKTDSRIDNIASKCIIPDEWYDVPYKIDGVPPLFIVNIQMPAENPILSIFSETMDGPGWSLVFYFKMSNEVAESLRDLTSISPALKQFIDFCQNAPEVDEDMNSPYRGRFKAIVRCENFDRFNFPSIVSGYNAKPALIRQTGNLVRGPGNRYIEMDINGHRFNAIAKGALQSILPIFPEVICSFGFCLEGREDSELPEILFGCATWNKPLLEGCVEWNI